MQYVRNLKSFCPRQKKMSEVVKSSRADVWVYVCRDECLKLNFWKKPAAYYLQLVLAGGKFW